jgi:hypothetical protein
MKFLPCTLDACLLGTLEDGLNAQLNIEIRASKLQNRASAPPPLQAENLPHGVVTMHCDITTCSSAHVSFLVSDSALFRWPASTEPYKGADPVLEAPTWVESRGREKPRQASPRKICGEASSNPWPGDSVRQLSPLYQACPSSREPYQEWNYWGEAVTSCSIE